MLKEVSPYVLLLISTNPLGFQLSIDGSITRASLLIYETLLELFNDRHAFTFIIIKATERGLWILSQPHLPPFFLFFLSPAANHQYKRPFAVTEKLRKRLSTPRSDSLVQVFENKPLTR